MDGDNDNLRAPKDEDGICIHYEESFLDHFARIARLMKQEDPTQVAAAEELVGNMDALELYGICSQGAYGDNTDEEPFFLDIVKWYMWSAWDDNRGGDMDTLRQVCINMNETILKEHGYEWAIKDPLRPGPSYYDDCSGDTTEAQSDAYVASDSDVVNVGQDNTFVLAKQGAIWYASSVAGLLLSVMISSSF